MNAARQKVEAEGECRVCGEGRVRWLDAAHLVPRSMLAGQSFDDADAIVPLCSRFKSNGRAAGCHEAFDSHQLDLLPFLTLAEEIAAVKLAKELNRRGSGIAGAYRLLASTWEPSGCEHRPGDVF